MFDVGASVPLVRQRRGTSTSGDARTYITIVGRKIMLTLLKRALWLLLCLAMVLPASAYQALPGQSPATPGNGNTAAADPLGRNTPSGTLYGFLQAAQSGNYSIAAQYLQMSAARRQSQGEDAAAKLKVVIDRAFSSAGASSAMSPDGPEM